MNRFRTAAEVVPPVVQQTKKSRVIKSTGRGQVCAPQGNIVSTVTFNLPSIVHATRKPLAAEQATKPLYAQLGDPEDFRIQQGDLVYSLVERTNDLFVRQSVDRDGEEVVFACVNGLPIEFEIRFAGHCDYSPHVKSSDGNTEDTAGTIARCGTRTVINTGPNPIGVNELVYFSPYPLIATEQGSNNQFPAVQEPGQSKNKARPALYGLKEHNIYAALSNIEEKVKAVADAAHDYDTYKPAVDNKIRNEWFSGYPNDYPAVQYTYLFGMYWARTLGHIDDTQLKADLKLYWYDARWNNQSKYLEAIGKQISGTNPINSVVPGAAGAHEALGELLRQALNQARSRQYDYLRSHAIGTCTRGGATGQPIDLTIGYFFA